MPPSDIHRKLTTILVELLNCRPEEVTPDAYFSPESRPADSKNLEHLGADSLDWVEIIMATEEEFGIDIPDAAAETLKTVQDAITYIENRI